VCVCVCVRERVFTFVSVTKFIFVVVPRICWICEMPVWGDREREGEANPYPVKKK